MKRWFLTALALLILVGLLVTAIERDPGYVLIAYGGYSLEMSFWLGLVLFTGLMVLVYAGMRMLRGGFKFSISRRGWMARRRDRRSQRRTTQGLIAFIEGNWGRSRRLLERGAARSETPLLNYLVAARASNALGDQSAMQGFLSKAERSVSGAGIAVELTQAELLLRNGQLEECLATLQRARRNAARHPFVLDLLQQVYLGLKDWAHLIELLPELKQHKLLSPDRQQALEQQAYRERLRELGARKGEGVEQALHTFWRSLPKHLARDSDMVALYAGLLLERGSKAEAETLVRSQLKRSWSPQLIDLYGRIDGPDSRRQLLAAEQWLTERNNDSGLLLCLGRLSMRNELWGKARDYFENSLKLQESPEVCAELGRLLSHLGEHALSNQYFQRGLLASTHGLPKLPMPGRQRVA